MPSQTSNFLSRFGLLGPIVEPWVSPIIGLEYLALLNHAGEPTSFVLGETPSPGLVQSYLWDHDSPGAGSSSDPPLLNTFTVGVHNYLTLQEIARLQQTSPAVRDEINQHGGQAYVQSLLHTEIWQLPPVILDGLILMGHVLSNPPSAHYLNGLSDAAFRQFMSQHGHLLPSNIVGLDDHRLALLTRSQFFSAFVNCGPNSAVITADGAVIAPEPFHYLDDRSAIREVRDAIERQIPREGRIPQSLIDQARQFMRALGDYYIAVRSQEIQVNDEDRHNYDLIRQEFEQAGLLREQPGGGIIRVRRLCVITEDIADNAQTSENLDANEFHHPQDFLQTQLETTQDHDWFGLVLLQGSTYTFRMNKLSGNLDTFLTLRDARGNEVTHNDDSDGTLNSRITFTAEKSDVYFLDASSYASSYSGSYEIRSNLDVGALKAQGSYTSALSADKKSQLFKIELKAGHKYEFLMNRVSTDTHFDAYLYLRDANKNEITRDDDSGGSLNSKISYTAHSDGVYYLDATSYKQYSVGQVTVVSHQVI